MTKTDIQKIKLVSLSNKTIMQKETLDFIAQILKTKVVYALQFEEGYAMSLSNHFVNDDDELIEMFCFWSDERLAKHHIKEEWSEYTVAEIPLSEFLEDWCIAMSDENLVGGLNLDLEMEGEEVDTLELLIEILHQLKKANVELEFKKFKSVNQLLQESKQAIKYE